MKLNSKIDEGFNYMSVVGMAWYLCNNSRPDLQMSVSQCERYTFCPKHSPEKALKRIGRYLKKHRGRGLVMRPKGGLKNDYVNANFAGLWDTRTLRIHRALRAIGDMLCVFGNCPVICSSRLKQEIALSAI